MIERYTAGTCSDDELEAIGVHLTECDRCRQQTEAARSGITSPDEGGSAHLSPGTGSRSIEKTLALDDENGIQPPSEPGESRSHKNIHSQPVEKTRVLGDGSTPPTTSGSESLWFSQHGSDGPVDKTIAIDDTSQVESVSQLTTFPSAGQNFAKALESMISGYEVLEEMPRGGQAAVYKAIHTATKTKVAIKVLLPTLLASARARHYFEREAELIASLDHPNIVSIRDSGIIHHQYYFVMQYIDGQPLERYVRRQELSFRETVVLFQKVCTAITYAHQQGIIHRDLKFGNILVDKRGEPHVLDFGLAKAVGLSEKSPDKALATMTGQLSGTLSTMSPEQAAGRPDQIDVRTDVYSLGVMLYHMLTRQYPYDVSGTTLEALQNIQKADPVRPRQIDRKFDSDVEAIILTALAKDPAERYQSAAELQSEIDNWLAGRPIRVKSISTMYLLRKIITRHKYSSAVAALLFLIILGFAYTCFNLYLTAEKARKEQEQYAASLSAQTARAKEVTRLFAFNNFLENWRLDFNSKAAEPLVFLSKGSKEQKAAMFLFDPRPVAEKEDIFRQGFSDEYCWFVDFIIAENHLRNGDREQALEAIKRSYEAIPRSLPNRSPSVDNWLIRQVRSRRRQLSTVDEPKVKNKE
ncbi:MAG: serine/threonine protein kinase [Planctomycetota bacterium]